MDEAETSPPFVVSLISGGMAGTAVDVSLFPLDTIKTRLQAEQGFWKAGGFRNIYAGLGAAALGSAPTAALFFCTYDTAKHVLVNKLAVAPEPACHMTAAALGEVAACLIRVPVEIIKQRRQADAKGLASSQILRSVIKTEGFSGLYRGFLSTVIRDTPFSLLQLPVWELLKKLWSRYQNEPVHPLQSAVCGAVAGGFSGAVTTPLDVAKTRIMLAEFGSELAQRDSIIYTLKMVGQERGLSGLYAGVLPRTIWISIGGFVFFGVYEKCKSLLMSS